MNIKLETAFYLLGIIQAIQVLFFGWKKRSNLKEAKPFINVYLVVFIVCIILELMTSIAITESFYLDYPIVLFMTAPLIVLYGPMIYFYALSLSSKKSDRPAVLPHLMWSFIWFLLYLPILIFLSKEEMLALVNGQIPENYYYYYIFIFVVLSLIEVMQLTYYIYKSYSLIKSYQNNLSAFYSFQKNISLNWITRLIYSFILLLFIYIFFDVLELPVAFDINVIDYALIVWVLYFSYLIILHKDQKIPNEMIENSNFQVSNKGVKSTIKEEDIFDFEKCVLNQELYLDPDLNLAKLSDSCDISRHRASILLNEGFNASFYDYINHLRINYSKKLLIDKNYTRNILAVAYDSGFKSRSAFYTAFRKWENKTPSQFLKSIN